MTKKQREKLREQGRRDYLDGKPIDAFCDLDVPYTEASRAVYELGWREEKEEARLARLRNDRN